MVKCNFIRNLSSLSNRCAIVLSVLLRGRGDDDVGPERGASLETRARQEAEEEHAQHAVTSQPSLLRF